MDFFYSAQERVAVGRQLREFAFCSSTELTLRELGVLGFAWAGLFGITEQF